MLWLLTLACQAVFPEGDTAILPDGLTPNIEVDEIYPSGAFEYGLEGICLVGRGFEGEIEVSVDDRPCDLDTIHAWDLDPDDSDWFRDHLSCGLPENRINANTNVPVSVRRGEGPPVLLTFTYEPAPVIGGEEQQPVGASAQPCCALDYPDDLNLVPAGVSSEIQVRVDPQGAAEMAIVQVGWGPLDSNPAQGCWAWTPAQNQGQDERFPNDTLFQGTLTAPAWPGAYHAAARASVDGGMSWQYCDFDTTDSACVDGNGAGTGYSPDNAIDLVVE